MILICIFLMTVMLGFFSCVQLCVCVPKGILLGVRGSDEVQEDIILCDAGLLRYPLPHSAASELAVEPIGKLCRPRPSGW